MRKSEPAIHVVIPDTQVKPGTPIDYLDWVGRYIVEQFAGKDNIKIIHLGDHADMPSLSSYDEGKKEMEGRRYKADIGAANVGFDLLNNALTEYNLARRRHKEKKWLPERHILLGNHEDRINRAISLDAKLDGTISTDDLNYSDHGWQVHPFLAPVSLDGVWYAHYFYNHNNGRPLGGMVESRLKNIGHTFTQGHQQGLWYGIRYVAGKQQNGLVAGSCYLHDEDYKGPQGNAHWRGIVICHQVESGSYDPMFVSLDFLCRKYAGKRLSEYTPKIFAPDSEGNSKCSPNTNAKSVVKP